MGRTPAPSGHLETIPALPPSALREKLRLASLPTQISMKHVPAITACVALFLTACASPPAADPSVVEAGCAQQCSVNLSSCSSGFKMFPVVQQKQCNDTYDVCIKGCPARTASTPAPSTPTPTQSTADRLKAVDDLYRSGAISKDEHALKRKQILDSL